MAVTMLTEGSRRLYGTLACPTHWSRLMNALPGPRHLLLTWQPATVQRVGKALAMAHVVRPSSAGHKWDIGIRLVRG